MGHPDWLWLFNLLRLLLSVSALVRNITIDDQFGDQITHKAPEFSPPVAWATQTCSGCAIKPDVTEMYNGTFTAATFMPDKNILFNAIDFTFNGAKLESSQCKGLADGPASRNSCIHFLHAF